MLMPDKDNPSAEWIEQLRHQFRCEPEVDRILTRKMRRRGGAGYSAVSLQTLVAGVESLIRANVNKPFEISGARWLTGGASKVQMAFSLTWNRPGIGHETTLMVLRMEPAESLVETSRLREFQILTAFQGIVPVPQVFWVDIEGEHLPYPAMVASFVSGVTKPPGATSHVTGMGAYIAPEWRPRLGPQFVDCLARIHKRDIPSAGLTAFEVPPPGTASAELTLNTWERIWNEDSDEDIPLMRLAAVWLRENMPPCAKPVILHGDYRVGNFLFNETDAKITAILDWELSRIGDHHWDLVWASARDYGHYAEDGTTFLAGGFMSRPEFFDTYQQASGLAVDPKSLYYYRVMAGYIQGVMAAASSYRAARNGKTHQDVLQIWIVGIVYKMLDDLRILLEQGA